MTQEKIELALPAAVEAPPGAEAVPHWPCREFQVGAIARGAGESVPTLQLQPDDVVEIETAAGTRLLVAAADAHRYLPVSRAGGPLQLSPTLVLQGPEWTRTRPASRDSVGEWLVRAVRIHHAPSAVTALTAAGRFQDGQLLGGGPGLYRLSTQRWELSPAGNERAAAQPMLLFLHGTASSTEGSFRGLWDDAARQGARGLLAAAYGEHIWAYEHRTITDSPVANALALATALPAGSRLHLVSHSRGGLVGELLARGSREGGEVAFTEQEVALFLAQAQAAGRAREAYEPDAERLRELARVLAERRIRVERFVRVAAPMRGTTLVSGRLDRWATVMLNLLALPLQGSPAYLLFKEFLLSVVKERTDARVLPGLEAMMPDSPLVALLNAPGPALESALHVIAGEHEGGSLLARLGDWLAEAFYGGESDLVVNTPSMTGGAPRTGRILLKPLSGAEVNHLNYFERAESVLPLLRAVQGSEEGFQALAAPGTAFIARGGLQARPKPDAPIVLVLPGIMGSHLRLDGRIWVDLWQLAGGGMARLKLDAHGVEPDGWVDSQYERFARYLSTTHEVRPFTYDWRLSIRHAAQRFESVLLQAMQDAAARGKPLRIAAHSMGGLVARLALKDHWAAFKALPGSRLIQFGTPNHGSHSMAAALAGRDAFVRMVERLDTRHDMNELLQIVSHFPGVLELLPHPFGGQAAPDGVDYFDPATWQAWHKADAENRRTRALGAEWEEAQGAGDGWPAPLQAALQAARQAVTEIQAAPLDPECTLYVAGSERTPVGVRFQDGRMQIAWTPEGDGRVPWRTGIPAGVKSWYVDAAHGDLLAHEDAFPDYVALLNLGYCALPTQPSPAQRSDVLAYEPVSPPGVATLQPTQEDLVAAAMGGRPPHRRTRGAAAAGQPWRARWQVMHGSFALARAPVLAGAYANDSLRGTSRFLDGHLGGALKAAQTLGRWPQVPGETALFLPPVSGDHAGAIMVGLGPVGELQPGELARSLMTGLLDYARAHAAAGLREILPLPVAALMVGSGFGGLSIEVAVRCLCEAVLRANRQLEAAGARVRIADVAIWEEEEGRALCAADALLKLADDARFVGSIAFEGSLTRARGGWRAAGIAAGGGSGWHRVHITRGDSGGLRFTLVTRRARNAVSDEADQAQAVGGLLAASTGSTADQPGLSRALFELMVPNAMKEALPDVDGVVLGVDAAAAAYPWELMRDAPESEKDPLVTRIGVVRQLATVRGGSLRVPVVTAPTALAVGDTVSGCTELPGAQAEAQDVQHRLVQAGFDTRLLRRPGAQEVLVHLFDRPYRVLHLAAHGAVRDAATAEPGGVLLGPRTRLTPSQVAKMRHVPELVFLNCCHLGSMAQEPPQVLWGEVAAGLAAQFIEMGARAVVAAGWSVDDAAAATFAATFYDRMLGGDEFGEALRAARQAAFVRHPGSNTWGAYQGYGDETYRLLPADADDWRPPRYLHPAPALAAVDQWRARWQGAAAAERPLYEARLALLDEAIAPRFGGHGPLQEALGAAWEECGNVSRALARFGQAVLAADPPASLRAVERLADLEIQDGAARARTDAAEGKRRMEQGLARIEKLLAMGRSPSRLCVLGGYHLQRARQLREPLRAAALLRSLQAMAEAFRGAWELSTQWGAPDPDAAVGTALAVLELSRCKPEDVEGVVRPIEVISNHPPQAWQRVHEAVRTAGRVPGPFLGFVTQEQVAQARQAVAAHPGLEGFGELLGALGDLLREGRQA